jgi:hypothetical protein
MMMQISGSREFKLQLYTLMVRKLIFAPRHSRPRKDFRGARSRMFYGRAGPRITERFNRDEECALIFSVCRTSELFPVIALEVSAVNRDRWFVYLPIYHRSVRVELINRHITPLNWRFH